MVEVYEAGFLADFFFEFVDGAGGIDGFDAAAVGADEVVAVDAGNEEGEVGCSFVEAEAADHSFVAEALEEAENGGFVALLGKMSTRSEVGQSHGAIVFRQAGQKCLQRFGATQTGGACFFEEVGVERHFKGGFVLKKRAEGLPQSWHRQREGPPGLGECV